MVISSANFGIYVAAWKRGIRVLWENTEFKVYLSIVAAATILISLNLMLESGLYAPSALLEALFTSASLSSTTGFISYDFETWPHFSQVILLILMFIGGCGGSTSGGLKVTRIILLFKSMTAVLRQKLHPRAVIQTRAGGENFSESMLLEVFCFFFIYTMSIFLWTALIAASGAVYSFCPGPFHCHHEQLGAGTGTIRRHLQLVGHACHDKNGRRPVHAYGPA